MISIPPEVRELWRFTAPKDERATLSYVYLEPEGTRVHAMACNGVILARHTYEGEPMAGPVLIRGDVLKKCKGRSIGLDLNRRCLVGDGTTHGGAVPEGPQTFADWRALEGSVKPGATASIGLNLRALDLVSDYLRAVKGGKSVQIRLSGEPDSPVILEVPDVPLVCVVAAPVK